MSSLWSILMALCLASVSATLSSDEQKIDSKRYDYNRGRCTTGEGVFRHGQIVSTRRSPCLKYRCEFGRLKLLEVACPHAGTCHRVGSIWQDSCHTYTCRKMYYNSYRIDRLRSGCTDATGRCRNPGETFPYRVNGRVFYGCTCTSTPEVIRYSCNKRRGRGRGRGRRQITDEVQL